MGIKNFSQTFEHDKLIKIKEMKGLTIAIDAMTEIYRASLGAKYVNTLTDDEGKPTLYLSVILLNIFEFYKSGVNQIWVFDYDQKHDESFHNPDKIDELLKRKKKKDEAMEKIKKIREEVLFSDSEEENEEEKKTADINSLGKKTIDINSLEKQIFSVNHEIIEELKLMLNCLNIQWVESPRGFEGEAVATYLNITGKANAVYSGDTDPIAMGAKVLFRKNTRDKQIYVYTQNSILKQIRDKNENIEDPSIKDIRKIAMILGTDWCEKTPRIGAKTVIKKLHNIDLTKKQKEKMHNFEKLPNEEIQINNSDKIPFVNCNIEGLILWLVKNKKFNEDIWRPRFEKAINERERSLLNEREGPFKPQKHKKGKINSQNIKTNVKKSNTDTVVKIKSNVENTTKIRSNTEKKITIDENNSDKIIMRKKPAP